MKLIPWMVIFAFILSACTTAPTGEVIREGNEETAVTQPGAGYPVVVEKNIFPTAYPAGAATPVVEEMVMPTVDSTLGQVGGVLVENGKPLDRADLYLAEFIKNASGVEIAASFDRSSSPRARTNEKGEFEFVNVPAGKYGLVYDTVIQSYLLLDPATNEQLSIMVENGQRADFGRLEYVDLPKEP